MHSSQDTLVTRMNSSSGQRLDSSKAVGFGKSKAELMLLWLVEVWFLIGQPA